MPHIVPLKQFPVCNVEREDVNRVWQSQRVEETDTFREPRQPEFVEKHTREKGIVYSDRALELYRGIPSSLRQILTDLSYVRGNSKVGERTTEKQKGQKIPETQTRLGFLCIPIK